MDKTKGKRANASEGSSNIQATADTEKPGSGRIWVRDDGAICIENECIVIQPTQDGTIEFTVDPNRCSCESGEALYKAILGSALSGKGSRITIKPKIE